MVELRGPGRVMLLCELADAAACLLAQIRQMISDVRVGCWPDAALRLGPQARRIRAHPCLAIARGMMSLPWLYFTFFYNL